MAPPRKLLESVGRGSDALAAQGDFRRMMVRILVASLLMVASAIWYLSLFGPLTTHMVVATVLGVFFSVLLGCGLFAAAFFSAKSGHDQVVTDATARRAISINPAVLPDGLDAYRRTDRFTETSVPSGLLRDHSTKAGTWGLIRVAKGRLRYRITDPRRPALETILSPETPPGIVEPTILHHVEPLGPVCFDVEFYRRVTA